MRQATSMDVSTAVNQRLSVRQFLDTPVPDELLRELLTKASRSPSGGNVQPWKIYVLNGDATHDFLASIAERPLDPPEYEIYPPNLWEPHRTTRFELGEDMYATLGIERADKAGRLGQMAKNYEFFGAPAAIFMYLDRRMLPPQWSDAGMYLQTLMLLCEEAGLATCAQEIWSTRHQAVSDFVGAPDELMLFCGMAIGYKDVDAPVNSLRSKRLALDEFATFV
ncbi:MAG: nitroreductase [Acidimicrobiales bacterium]